MDYDCPGHQQRGGIVTLAAFMEYKMLTADSSGIILVHSITGGQRTRILIPDIS
jgi:hypothetical protein